MTKKRVTLMALIVLPMILVANVAISASSTIIATLTASDPTFNRFLSACSGVSGSTQHYATLTVKAQVAGDYALYDNGFFDADPATIDGYIGFYQLGGFDPASPLTNCVDSGDDTSIITIPAPGSYTVVLTSFTSLATGTVSYTIEGPAELIVVQTGVPTLSTGGLIILSAMLVVVMIMVNRRRQRTS